MLAAPSLYRDMRCPAASGAGEPTACCATAREHTADAKSPAGEGRAFIPRTSWLRRLSIRLHGRSGGGRGLGDGGRRATDDHRQETLAPELLGGLLGLVERHGVDDLAALFD